VLTVDYDRLGVRPGDRLLDLGCGFGRHAYEAIRRGADVVACDLALDELAEVRKIYGVMQEDGETPEGVSPAVTCADATKLPFPDGSFDRIIASEVLEHIPDDMIAISELARVLRPGGSIAVTVPARFSESICWRLSDEYYAPKAEGGHVRIYRRSELEGRLQSAGLTPWGHHQAHAIHAPYWWLRCAVGPENDEHAAVRAYHRLLCWDIESQPKVTRYADRLLNPVIGKSLAVYSTKPAVPWIQPEAARPVDALA
jgi:SAM-dependent methyltransferase